MKLYEDVRELAAIDLGSIVAQYLRATMLPNQGSGQTITEIVSGQNITFTAPLIWNADGSVTQNQLVANGEKQTLPISPSADLHTDDVIVVIHSINNSSNSGNKAPMLGWYGTGARDLVIQSYTWGVNTRATVKESWETIALNSTKNAASSNEFSVYHWISATNTLNQYEDGVLTGSVTGTKNASNPLTTLKLSLGLANDKFFSSQLYSKSGAFTNPEVNEIVHNPYGVFQSSIIQQESYSGSINIAGQYQLALQGVKSYSGALNLNNAANVLANGYKASFNYITTNTGALTTLTGVKAARARIYTSASSTNLALGFKLSTAELNLENLATFTISGYVSTIIAKSAAISIHANAQTSITGEKSINTSLYSTHNNIAWLTGFRASFATLNLYNQSNVTLVSSGSSYTATARNISIEGNIVSLQLAVNIHSLQLPCNLMNTLTIKGKI